MKKKKSNLPPFLWTYYPQEKSGYLKLKSGAINNTLSLVEGKVFLDRDKNLNVLGVEIIL